MSEPIKYKLLSIDAWREPEGGWTWNDMRLLEDGIYLDPNDLTPRKLLGLLRKWDYLTPASKGKLTVREIDGVLFEVMMRNTGEPVLALSSIH